MAANPQVDLDGLDPAAAAQFARDTGDALAGLVVDVARELTYTAVGLGVLAYQRAQVRRREIERELRRSAAD